MSIKKTENSGFNGLKVLCILSMIGFVCALGIDAFNYYTYSNYGQFAENIEDVIEKWEEAGVDISANGISKIAKLFLIRGIIDVFAFLGIYLMFYRLKLGYNIYVIFQLAYVAVPFVILGDMGKIVIPIGLMAINLIYVALFTTQRKHLLK